MPPQEEPSLASLPSAHGSSCALCLAAATSASGQEETAAGRHKSKDIRGTEQKSQETRGTARVWKSCAPTVRPRKPPGGARHLMARPRKPPPREPGNAATFKAAPASSVTTTATQAAQDFRWSGRASCRRAVALTAARLAGPRRTLAASPEAAHWSPFGGGTLTAFRRRHMLLPQGSPPTDCEPSARRVDQARGEVIVERASWAD